ncbi:MAG: outer membrane beta-barrel protein [Xanthobacteraceae bacterium]
MALAAMIAGPAMAADMPVKAKTPAAVVAYNWSGVYVGVNVGGGWADVDRFYPQAIGGPLTASTRVDGALVGFHAGAQGQWGNWVLGIEVAFSTGLDDVDGFVALPTPPFAADTSARHKIGDLLTVGPRLGFARDNWLIYGTGGYAVANINAEYAFTSTGAARFPGFWGQSRNDGWFVGAGVEHVVHKGSLVDVIFGAEYQHIELREENSFCFTACNPPNAEDYRTSAVADIVRARLTLKTHGYPFLAR